MKSHKRNELVSLRGMAKQKKNENSNSYELPIKGNKNSSHTIVDNNQASSKKEIGNENIAELLLGTANNRGCAETQDYDIEKRTTISKSKRIWLFGPHR